MKPRSVAAAMAILLCLAAERAGAGDAAREGVDAGRSALPRIEKFELEGGRWSCEADGLPLSGWLLLPEGPGPHPAVVISHGMGGSGRSMLNGRGREFVRWGFAAIATDYTHAGATGRLDRAQAGASPENLRRGLGCVGVLRQLPGVDRERIVLYGNSMGGFLTVAMAAAAPGEVAAAVITAGGIAPDGRGVRGMPGVPGAEVARRVRTPFLILHGSDDTTVPPRSSERLAELLVEQNVPFKRYVIGGVGHNLFAAHDPKMNGLINSKIHEWLESQGLLAATPAPAPTPASAEGF